MNTEEIDVCTRALEWMEEAISLIESQFGRGSKTSLLGAAIVDGEEHPEVAAMRKLIAGHLAA